MSRDNVLSADNQQGRLYCNLPPWYVTGFVDGEGSFHVAIYTDSRMKTKWKIIPEFHVSQRQTSRRVLDELVNFFQCGYVKANHAKNPKDVTYVFCVRNRDDLLTKVIPFFEAYVLMTEKAKDFRIFASVVRAMYKGMHLRERNIKSILNRAYTMNGAGRYRRSAKRW